MTLDPTGCSGCTRGEEWSDRTARFTRLGTNRINDVRRLYDVLDGALGGPRHLGSCSGQLAWPARGVYFFMEDGEERLDSGLGQRVVRVGTHALTPQSASTLWGRLRQHRGRANGTGGNHRGSIFRLLVGASLLERGGQVVPTWGVGASAPRDVRDREQPLEAAVSQRIGQMPFLWLAIDDEPGPASLRGYIERNTLALLSNYGREVIDPPSPKWLGNQCNRDLVRSSGLWNSRHVGETHDPPYLDTLEKLIDRIGRM